MLNRSPTTFTPTLKEVRTWVWSDRGSDGNREKKWRTHLQRGVIIRNETRAQERRKFRAARRLPRPVKAKMLGPWPGWPFV